MGLVCLLAAAAVLPGVGAQAAEVRPAPAGGYKVEIWLPRDQKPHDAEIRRQLESVGVTRLTIAYVHKAPMNFAVGRNASADLARVLIGLAERHIGGVRLIIAEQRFFPDYGTIGSSAYDEIVQVPIRPENVERLKDPALSNDAWHRLYRQLTGEKE
jgi:hypothetical protein